MVIELFLKTLKNELIQAVLWFCCSAHVIRDGRFSQYLGVVPTADDHLLMVPFEIDTGSLVGRLFLRLNFFED